MSGSKKTSLLIPIISALVVLALGLTTLFTVQAVTPAAKRSPSADREFIKEMRKDGSFLNSFSDRKLISLAEQTCELWKSGATYSEVLDEHDSISRGNLLLDISLIGHSMTSTRIYCPEYQYRIKDALDSTNR